MIVKIGADGQVYADTVVVSRAELAERVARLNQDNGVLVYYRESPAEPTPEAEAVFRALLELRPRKVLMGSRAPSEWGRLDWVEVERSPMVSRFFLARDQKFLISRAATPGEAKASVLVGGPLPAEQQDLALGRIDLLIRSDRVLETPFRRPELALGDATRTQAGLHLRIAYERGRWASWYPEAELPSHVASFHDDLWRFAARFVAAFEQGSWQTLQPDQARQLFR